MEFLILVLRSTITLLVGVGTLFVLGFLVDWLEDRYKAVNDFLYMKDNLLIWTILAIGTFAGTVASEVIVRLIK